LSLEEIFCYTLYVLSLEEIFEVLIGEVHLLTNWNLIDDDLFVGAIVMCHMWSPYNVVWYQRW